MEYTIGLPSKPEPWSHPHWTRLIQSRVSHHWRKVGPILPEMLQPDPKKRPSADDCLSKFLSYSSGLPTMKALKRGRYQLSTIREPPVTKIPTSAEARKHAHLDQSKSKVQPGYQILDLFGSRRPRNSPCVGSQLAAEAEGNKAQLDLFKSNFSRGAILTRQAHSTAETALRRSIEHEEDLGCRGDDEPTISQGERHEIVRQLLATREAEDGQALHRDSTSDLLQFRFSGFR
jgi:hypothetical protein